MVLKVGEQVVWCWAFPLVVNLVFCNFIICCYIYIIILLHPNENFLRDINTLKRKKGNGKQSLSVTWACLVQPGTAGRPLAGEWELTVRN